MSSRKDIEALMKRVNDTPGFVVPPELNGHGHRAAYRTDEDGNPTGTGVQFPSTPGDVNQIHMCRRKLRRHLGWIDPTTRTWAKRQRKAKTRNHMPRVSEIARVKETKPDVTSDVKQAARYLWTKILKLAEAQGDEWTWNGVKGYRWDGRVVEVMTAEWPQLHALSSNNRLYAVNRVRDALTSTERLVNIRQGNRSTPTKWFVRATWDKEEFAPETPVEVAETRTVPMPDFVAEPVSKTASEPSKSIVKPPVSVPTLAPAPVPESAPEPAPEPATTMVPGGPVTPAPVSGMAPTGIPVRSTAPSVEGMFQFLTEYDGLIKQQDALIGPVQRLFNAQDEVNKAVAEIGEILGIRRT